MRVVARGWGSCALVRARVLAWSVLGPRACARVVACSRACVLAGLTRVWVCARVVAWLRACVGWFGVWVCVGGRACVRGPPWWCVVAVSYSPAPPGVQYHWRGRA